MNRSTTVCVTVAVGLCAALSLAQTNDVASADRARTYGTQNESFYRIPAGNFTAFQNAPYSDTSAGALLRYSTQLNGEFIASPNLPSGAMITSMELDFCDTNSTYDVSASLIICSNMGADCAPQVGVSSTGAPGCGSVSESFTSPLVIDNSLNQATVAVATASGDSTNSFAGVIIGYKLQVSPPPGSADFGDVPTSHPFFQYIEALYHSGITAGCGGGNFCPNNPLTRGQMAVFLAKALGLSFN
jgi:hypothetical protein